MSRHIQHSVLIASLLSASIGGCRRRATCVPCFASELASIRKIPNRAIAGPTSLSIRVHLRPSFLSQSRKIHGPVTPDASSKLASFRKMPVPAPRPRTGIGENGLPVTRSSSRPANGVFIRVHSWPDRFIHAFSPDPSRTSEISQFASPHRQPAVRSTPLPTMGSFRKTARPTPENPRKPLELSDQNVPGVHRNAQRPNPSGPTACVTTLTPFRFGPGRVPCKPPRAAIESVSSRRNRPRPALQLCPSILEAGEGKLPCRTQ
jgi:hypothetical protein